MRITLAETQIETAQNVAKALESQTGDTVVVIFDEPFVERGEYAESELFGIRVPRTATVEDIKKMITDKMRERRLKWNRAAFRKAINFLASQDDED